MSILVNNNITALPGSGGQATPMPTLTKEASTLPPVVFATHEATSSEHGPPAKNSKTAALSPEDLKDQLDKALQKTGIKAEIELKDTGIMVVRYKDMESQQVAFQIPTQTVLDLIASLKQSAKSAQPAVSGAIIDQQA
ncbi:MAG TPA: flagellar protein FlaG [Capsulimonadaceae bacterium]